jgi:hypothetical protein
LQARPSSHKDTPPFLLGNNPCPSAHEPRGLSARDQKRMPEMGDPRNLSHGQAVLCQAAMLKGYTEVRPAAGKETLQPEITRVSPRNIPPSLRASCNCVVIGM